MSVDSGVTWHRASGTTSWTYNWIPTTAGTYTIASRATDDSLNTETPSTSGPTINVSPATGSSLFQGVIVADNQTTDDPSNVEVGLQFTASVSGTITGIRFWKGSINIGPHSVELWTSSGTMLASVAVANETWNGWQQVNLPAPVAINANTTYVVSYHTNGFYSGTGGYFNSPFTNGPLTATGGFYTYSTTVAFPTSTFNNSNYWVDVVFVPAQSPPAIPVISSALTASGTVGTPFNYTITATGIPTTFGATGLPAGLSVNTTTGAISGTPSAAGTSNITLSASNAMGTGTATLALSVIAPGTSGFSSTVPANITVVDTTPVELGVKLSSSAAGSITALRFYKGPQNVGTHVADLWSSTGTLLATATFTNETASGWQQVNLPAPVAISAGTTYIASYHTNGFYSGDGNYFVTAVTNAPLTFLASGASGGNGVYAYGGAGSFPSNSYNATNYVCRRRVLCEHLYPARYYQRIER